MRLAATIAAFSFLVLASAAAVQAAPRTEITIDPDQAEAKAKAVLLTEKDMPGKDWLGLTDIFADADLSDGLIPDTAACTNSLSKLADLGADIESERIARTNVVLTQMDTKDSDGLTVTVLVEVFPDGALTDLAGELKAIYRDDYIKCTQEASKQLVADATVKASPASAKAPGNGGVVAFDMDSPSLKIKAHQEIYDWVDGNVRIQLQVSGGRALVDSKIVNLALDKTVANLNKAAGR
jgi:hypothetical protein